MRKNKRKLQGQVIVSQEQYLKQLLTATIRELEDIVFQMKQPKAGRWRWSQADLEQLRQSLMRAREELKEVEADPSKRLALSTGDFS